jgi:hypothetical protein
MTNQESTQASYTEQTISSTLLIIEATFRLDANYNTTNITQFRAKAHQELINQLGNYSITITDVRSGSILMDFSVTLPITDENTVVQRLDAIQNSGKDSIFIFIKMLIMIV